MRGYDRPVTLAARLARTLPALERRVLEGEEHPALERGLAAAVGRHVGYDAACLATLDPVTAMWTHCSLVGMERDPRLEALLFEREYRSDDVGKLVEVSRRRVPVSVLSLDTGGDLAKSARYRDGYRPAGFSDELRSRSSPRRA